MALHEANPQPPGVQHTAMSEALQNQDLLREIFMRMDLKEVCRVQSVCRQWHEAASSPQFWSKIDVSSSTVPPDALRDLLLRHNNVLHLNVRGTALGPHHFTDVIPHLNQLTHLELDLPATMNEFNITNNHLPALNNLIIARNYVPPAAVDPPLTVMGGEFEEGLPPGVAQQDWEDEDFTPWDTALPGVNTSFSVSHPTITNLCLEDIFRGSLAVHCPEVEELKVQVTANTVFMGNAPNLTRLVFKGCSPRAPRNLLGFLRMEVGGLPTGELPMLRTLEIQNTHLTNELLARIARARTEIETLVLRLCIRLSGERFGADGTWRNLHTLTVSRCENISGSSLAEGLSQMISLKDLTVEYCQQIILFKVESKSLAKIKLRGLRSLTRLELQCPVLSDLELCPIRPGLPAAHALYFIGVSSTALTSLHLAACPAMKQLDLSCPNLASLELSDCHAVTSETLQALGHYTACPRLLTLSITACDSLEAASFKLPAVQKLSITECLTLHRLDIECPQLLMFNVTECSHLEYLNIKAEHMEQLSLGACPNLASLSLGAPLLKTLDLRGCHQLSDCDLVCPALKSVDASLCSSLGDLTLAAFAQCEQLEDLQLGACSAVTPAGIATLGSLPSLRRLDLSYMPLEDPVPLLPLCTHLTSLALRDIFTMRPDDLDAMIRMLRSDTLSHLDLSYCHVSPTAVPHLLLAAGVSSIALNGLRMISSEPPLWMSLHGEGPPSALRTLSMVSNRGMDAFYLGLIPEDQGLGHGWVESPTPLSSLEEIRMGVGEFNTVAISLMNLKSLELNNCCNLGTAELRCPALTHLSFAACRKMSSAAVCAALAGCPSLVHLDVKMCPAMQDAEAQAAVRSICPLLKIIDVDRQKEYYGDA